MSLKITEVERISLKVPFRATCRPWMEVDLDSLQFIDVFRVSTSDPDIVGYGESPARYGSRRVAPDSLARVTDTNPASLAMDDSLGNGLQMALLDILGQYLGVPAWQLLEPDLCREAVAISWWSSQLTPLEALTAEAELAQSEGYLAHKLKARPWCNVFDQVKTISAVTPRDYKIDLDWNGMLQSRGEAAALLQSLDGFDHVGIYESPIRMDDIEGMARLRQQVARPLAEHYRPATYRHLLRTDAVDGFVLFAGGVAELLRQDHVVYAFDKSHWLQIIGTGLTTAFAVHLAAVMPGARWPLITCLNAYSDDLLESPLQISGGEVKVPDGPGLGVVVDEHALECYRIDPSYEPAATRKLLLVGTETGAERVYRNTSDLRRDACERGWTLVQPADVRLAIWTDDGGADFERTYQRAELSTTLGTLHSGTGANLPAPRADFHGLNGRHYLYTGAEGPALRAHDDAIARYVRNKSAWKDGRDMHDGVMQSCRDQVAELIGGNPDNVALLSNASEALNRIIGSIRWAPGMNAVTTNLEFPSVVQPLLRLRSQGVEARVVQHRDWNLDVDDLARAVDDKTGVIVVSHVSYMSGLRLDLDALSRLAAESGVLLVVDATQSLGVIPVDATRADFVVASTYKWMLGPHGVGVVYCRDPGRLRADPDAVGWRSVPEPFTSDRFERYELWPGARQLELGFPSFPSLYMLDASLRYLGSFAPLAVEKHVHALGSALAAGLASLGVKVVTPTRDARRAGNIAFLVRDGEVIARRLADKGILAWGGDGRVRFSVHLFNDDDDVDATLQALPDVL